MRLVWPNILHQAGGFQGRAIWRPHFHLPDRHCRLRQ